VVGRREVQQEAVLAGGGGVGRKRQRRDVGQCEVSRCGLGCAGLGVADRSGSARSDRWRGVGRVAWEGRVRARGRSVGGVGSVGWGHSYYRIYDESILSIC
jgi:hypothetical protein